MTVMCRSNACEPKFWIMFSASFFFFFFWLPSQTDVSLSQIYLYSHLQQVQNAYKLQTVQIISTGAALQEASRSRWNREAQSFLRRKNLNKIKQKKDDLVVETQNKNIEPSMSRTGNQNNLISFLWSCEVLLMLNY